MLKNLQEKLKTDITDIKKELKDSVEVEKKCLEFKVFLKKMIFLIFLDFFIRCDKKACQRDYVISQKCRILLGNM